MTDKRYNPEIHHRRSIRLRGYDYAQEGLYFITLCVINRDNLFGEVVNGKMHLNSYGQIAHDEWLRTAEVRDNIFLHEFVIMPNHLHGIIEITKNKGAREDNAGFKSPTQTIGSIVRGYKIATLKKIREYIKPQAEAMDIEPESNADRNTGGKSETTCKGEETCKGELQFAPTVAPTLDTIWQRNYYEIIIRDEKAYHNISNYILLNPERWKEDEFNK